MPTADRDLWIELPDEDKEPLNRTVCGFRDASHIWMRDWQNFPESEGSQVGKANPSLFFNTQRNSRGVVHGDDFNVLARRSAIDHIGKVLASTYNVREIRRLGQL